MKKRSIIFVCAILSIISVCFAFAGCTDGKNEESDRSYNIAANKILVAYFSCTNNTRSVAQKIASASDGTLYEITPTVAYTAADLNYSDDSCWANREQNDPAARPEISGSVENMSEYDVIFLGYPIWWGTIPKIIYTFMEAYDFSGKTIIPFCTSGSTGISASVNAIRAAEPQATVPDGKRFAAGATEQTVQDWINKLNLHIKGESIMVKVQCGKNALEIELADNPSAKAFAQKLEDGDVTVTMDDYDNYEKVGELGFSLVQSNTQITTAPGDVILYLGNKITIYYDTNSWNFTLLGKIKNMTRESMLAFFGGKGEVTVTFSLK